MQDTPSSTLQPSAQLAGTPFDFLVWSHVVGRPRSFKDVGSATQWNWRGGLPPWRAGRRSGGRDCWI